MTAPAGPLGERPPWHVRIRLAPDDPPVGAGMLVADGHVVTCAHVVGAWSRDRRVLEPFERVWVDFQYVGDRVPIGAVVVEGGWHPPAFEDASEGDVAVLRLLEPPPGGAAPAPLRSTRSGIRERAFSTYGYPDNHRSDGVPSRGVIVDHARGGEWLALEAKTDRGQALEEGFSGAPVWVSSLRGVIGIVVGRDPRAGQRDPRSGFAIHCEALARYWPPLEPLLDLEQAVTEISDGELEELLDIALVPGTGLPAVRSVDMYTVGVSTSKGATTAEAPPPYVPRRADEELRAALDADETFLLVLGNSKSGKSRTMFELLRERLPTARLIVPRDDQPALAVLARSALPTGPDPCVVWLDDLGRFIGSGGLSVKVLEQFARRSPRVVVAATMTSLSHAALLAADDAGSRASRTARSVLARAKIVRLESRLTDEERAAAEELYPDEDFTDRGIGEQLVAAPALEQRYDDGREADPAGWAALQAAVDWRRIGLSGPMPHDVLEAVFPRYLALVRPDLDASGDTVADGLAWARTLVAGTVSLLQRVPGEAPAYRAFDYIVAYADGQRADGAAVPIPDFAWDHAIASLDDDDLLMVGFGAMSRGNRAAARGAFETAHRTGGDAEARARAAFVLGGIAANAGNRGGANLEEAAVLLEEAAASGVADLVPMAKSDLATVMIQMNGDPERIRQLLDDALASGDETAAPVAQLAMGVLLMNANDYVAARPWLEQALASQDPEVGSAVVAQLQGELAGQEMAERAGAPRSRETTELGDTLRRRDTPPPGEGQSEFGRLLHQAVVEGRAVLPFVQASLGGLLVNTGDVDRARVLLQSALNSGNDDVAPLARANLAGLLLRSGDVPGAIELLESAVTTSNQSVRWTAQASLGWLLAYSGTDVERGRALLAEAVEIDRPEAARAQCLLGDLEFANGNLDAAAAAYRRAHDAEQLAWGPYATVGLALVMSRRGDVDAALGLLEEIAASGDPEQSGRAADLMGDLLVTQGENAAAEEAYRQAARSDHPLWGPAGTIDLATLLFRRGDVDEAFALVHGVVDRGDPQSAPWASIQLGDMHRGGDHPREAETAYRSAIDSGHPAAGQAARIGLGNLSAAQGEAEAAQEWFEQAADGADPAQAARAADLLGDLLSDTDPEAAKRAYRRAIDGGSPEWAAQARVDLARLYLATEDIATAEPLLEAAATSPFPIQVATARILLGVIRVFEHDRSAADEQFRLAESVGQPAIVSEARLQIAKIAVETGEPDRAEVLLDGLISSSATLPYVREEAEVLLSAVRLRQGRPGEAQGLLEPAGDAARSFLVQGQSMFDANQIEAAGDFLMAAVERGSREVRAEAEVGLGMVRLVQGRWEDARALLEPIVESAPPALERQALRYLASALARLDRRAEAVGHLQRLVALPDDGHRAEGLLLLGRLMDVDSDPDQARVWLEQAALSGDRDVESDALAALDELRLRPRPRPLLGRADPPRAIESASAPDAPGPALPPLPVHVLRLLAAVASAEGNDAEAGYWNDVAAASS